MDSKQTHRSHVKAKSRGDGYLNTLAEQMPALDRLFHELDQGRSPNFLDIMAAISEMVAFYTDRDQIDEACEILEEKMSQKKCLFCC